MAQLAMRVKSLVIHATPYILGGILLVNILYISGMVDYIGLQFTPIIIGGLGLPGEEFSTLPVGFLRLDVAVVMLVPLGLEARQSVIGIVDLAAYSPHQK